MVVRGVNLIAKKYKFEHLLSDEGWISPGVIEIDSDGYIVSISKFIGEIDKSFEGICLPGLPNLHSHAFQRAMVGLSEIGGPNEDNFWTWQNTQC